MRNGIGISHRRKRKIENPTGTRTPQGFNGIGFSPIHITTTSPQNQEAIFQAVTFYVENGFSVIPIRLDGSKEPSVRWKPYQSKVAAESELAGWFDSDPKGIGIVCGKISGNYEEIDFDHDALKIYPEWRELVEEAAPGLLDRLLITKTPRPGCRVGYRCETIEGGKKLARREIDIPTGKLPRTADGALDREKIKRPGIREKEGRFFKILDLIETRGEGNYVIAPGSPPAVHPKNKPYKLIQGDFENIPEITPAEREILLDCARSFNEYLEPEREFKTTTIVIRGMRPGDALNADPNARLFVEELLRNQGCRISGNRITRPGGNRLSATLFDSGVLYNFSSSWNPLEADKAYSPFALYASLAFGGDFSLAAKELYKQGYYTKRQEADTPSAVSNSLKNPRSFFEDEEAVPVGALRIETVDEVFATIIEYLPQTPNLQGADGMKENVVVVAETIIAKAKELGLDFRVDGSLYVFNSQFWLQTGISRERVDSLIPFLTQATARLGLYGFTQKYHTFVDSLCKQFIVSVLSVQFTPNKTENVLINFKNGTLEISETGYRLREFNSKDFLTYQLQFSYDENATSPKWDKFLDEVLPADKSDPDKTRQKVLAEYFASCFTNLNLEKCLFNYGTGDNGKSVVFNVITALFGSENISYCSLENLSKHDSYLASLNNKLLNFSSETSHYVNSELLKKLASKEPIEVARKYENPITMTNYARLAFNANELPRAGKEFLHAFKRRFVIIPFDVRVEKHKINPNLAREIVKDELPGVMNWVLKGLDRLLTQGALTECTASDREVDKYMIEGDTVAQWLEDEVWIEDKELKPKACIQLKDLHKDYLDWCDKYRQAKTLGRDQLRKRLSEMHDIYPFEYRHKQYYRLKKAEGSNSLNLGLEDE